MIYLGCDPGFSGALAIISGAAILDCVDMPTVEVPHKTGTRAEIAPALLFDLLCRWQHQHGPIVCAVVEEVTASPQMGSVSAFRFGQGFGCLVSVIACMGIRTTLVRPAAWKKAFHLSKDKAASRAAALQLWPDEAARFARVKDDGRAEACLLAEFGRRTQG